MVSSEEKNELFTYTGIKVEQPLGQFFVGKISSSDITTMSQVEVRDMRNDDINQRLGIQRELNPQRVRELLEYVKTSDACFPNSVILSTKEKNIIKVENVEGDIYKISLRKCDETFQIIDGQHRIAGLENYQENKTFEINTSLFLDMDPEQQAILFATINSKQKGVNPSLLYDLHVMQTARNPIKSAHYIARILNKLESGALYNRITPLYSSFRFKDELKYTQSNFISWVWKYISGSDTQLLHDRDDLKKKVPLVYANDKIKKKLIFRNLFIDEKDADIANIINNYFAAVKKSWSTAWCDSNYVLGRTIGFNSLMYVLPLVIEKIGKYDTVITDSEFLNILKKLELNDQVFISNELNGSGQNKIKQLLKNKVESL